MSSIPFTQQHDALINVTSADVAFDPTITGGLPTDEKAAIDLAVLGFSDFVSGTYQQNSADVQDILSQVTVNNTDLRETTFHLLTSAPAASGIGFSTVGNLIKSTGAGLVVSSATSIKPTDKAAVSLVDDAGAWFVNLKTWNGISANVLSSGAVKDKQGMGSVLIQAASAALFAKLGKNAAVNNEDTVEGKQKKLANDIEATIVEAADTNYKDSKMFRRYLDSGRYDADGGDINSAQAYNLDKANFDYIVQLQGSVSDSNGTLTPAIVNRVLGTINDNKHQVKNNLSYKMNVFMRIQQRDAL